MIGGAPGAKQIRAGSNSFGLRYSHIAIVKKEATTWSVRILKVIDSLGVERRRVLANPVHLVALAQQQFGQIGPILSVMAVINASLVP